jgi:hypothetical protein
MSSTESFGKCALLVAHPGHEIHVHGWLETTRPIVYVLTDGSGRSGRSRLKSTTRLLAAASARPGVIYGRFADRALYEAVLRRDAALFCDLAAELADEIVRERFDFVLGDAAEGEILAHDVWRGVIDAALAAAEASLNKRIASYEFGLEGPPGRCPAELAVAALWRRLDDAALARKIAAARSYPELKDEVESALAAYGEGAFRLECLRPASAAVHRGRRAAPRYEQHGEALVAAGIYPETVRYGRHVAPLLARLRALQRAA